MKYSLYGGVVTHPTMSIYRRAMYFCAGAVIGIYAGLCVVYGQIQNSVQPIVTQDSDSTLQVEQPHSRPLGVEAIQGGEDNTAKTLQATANNLDAKLTMPESDYICYECGQF